MSKSDRCFVTAPLILLFPFYWNWYSPSAVSKLENTYGSKHINVPIHQITTPYVLNVTSLHEATPRHGIHYLVWRDPMYAWSAGPASLSVHCADGRSCWLIRESSDLTPEPHVPSSIVDHGDGSIPAMRRALHGSRHASSRASPRFPRTLCRG